MNGTKILWIKQNRDLGVLALRLFIGTRLVYGVADNVFSWDHMKAFAKFLASFGFPFPLISATASVYAQLLCGLMIFTGFYIRIASLIMIFNFAVALIMVHYNDSFENMTPALAILFSCILFLFNGAGKFALTRE